MLFTWCWCLFVSVRVLSVCVPCVHSIKRKKTTKTTTQYSLRLDKNGFYSLSSQFYWFELWLAFQNGCFTNVIQILCFSIIAWVQYENTKKKTQIMVSTVHQRFFFAKCLSYRCHILPAEGTSFFCVGSSTQIRCKCCYTIVQFRFCYSSLSSPILSIDAFEGARCTRSVQCWWWWFRNSYSVLVYCDDRRHDTRREIDRKI